MEPTLKAHRIRTVNASSNKLISVLVKRCPIDTAFCCGVYIIPCEECDLMYIGRTGKKLEVRLNQIKDTVSLAHANNAVFKHVRDTNHAINWGAAKRVFIYIVESHRLTVESALIRKNPNCNNVQSTLGVDAFFSEVILKSKPDIISRVLN